MDTKEFDKPEDFVNSVEIFSKKKLKHKIELLRIYESAIQSHNEKLFEELAFTAKYVLGLLRIVRNYSDNSEITNIEEIKKDFSDNMQKSIGQIKKIVQSSDEDFKKYLDENFFELSQQGFLNLTELLSDLEWAKIFLNNRKRS